MHPHRIAETEKQRAFALAGNALFTVVSTKTGTRFTFRVRKGEDNASNLFFVSVLSGLDNENNYSYLGTIFPDGYRHGKRSRVSQDAPSALAFNWLWTMLSSNRGADKYEFWHEGRCGRCGRTLTVPASIEAGIGPECQARILAMAA